MPFRAVPDDRTVHHLSDELRANIVVVPGLRSIEFGWPASDEDLQKFSDRFSSWPEEIRETYGDKRRTEIIPETHDITVEDMKTPLWAAVVGMVVSATGCCWPNR